VWFARGVLEPVLPFTERELHHWKLLDRFRERLLPHLRQAGALDGAGRQNQLTQEAYFSLFLFRMLNPIITSMRGLCAATSFVKMKGVVPQPVAPSSFSEAQHLFSPEILSRVVRDLAAQARGQMQFGDPQVRQAVAALTIVDGSLLRAVNRMAWTPQDSRRSAVRLHLHFSVFDQAPVDWSITPGKVSEIKEWKKMIQPDGFYVLDRLYCQDLLYLKKLQKDGVNFVVRLRDNFIRTVREPARALTPEDVQAGVVGDQMEELGRGGGGPILRVVQIEAGGRKFLLATTRIDLPAHLIGLIYRYRWQIELFFKWIKTMLPCRHWLAESPAGVSIQIYSLLIAALLLMLARGRRPNKREMEAMQFYWTGFISEEELAAALSAQKRK
jgi:hypothetical protein